MRDAAALFAERGAVTLLADAGGKGVLPALACDPVLEPILQIQSFYRMVNALAIARGKIARQQNRIDTLHKNSGKDKFRLKK